MYKFVNFIDDNLVLNLSKLDSFVRNLILTNLTIDTNNIRVHTYPSPTNYHTGGTRGVTDGKDRLDVHRRTRDQHRRHR